MNSINKVQDCSCDATELIKSFIHTGYKWLTNSRVCLLANPTALDASGVALPHLPIVLALHLLDRVLEKKDAVAVPVATGAETFLGAIVTGFVIEVAHMGSIDVCHGDCIAGDDLIKALETRLQLGATI
uniref:Uncharacterized protein n=1 Tax=Nelumbo nucifera TaxID=4432 RepID=A0A822Z4Z1_NELNU|nr:TPA_asm: hypothetical protein HUJ06_013946 [Nelumbo nucifera]